MSKTPTGYKLAQIVARDSRYALDVYIFVLDALDETIKEMEVPRHLSAYELLECIRRHAQNRFGTLGADVLATWGVTDAGDVGEVIYNMIAEKVLDANEEDKRSDFDIDFDFTEPECELKYTPQEIPKID